MKKVTDGSYEKRVWCQWQWQWKRQWYVRVSVSFLNRIFRISGQMATDKDVVVGTQIVGNGQANNIPKDYYLLFLTNDAQIIKNVWKSCEICFAFFFFEFAFFIFHSHHL